MTDAPWRARYRGLPLRTSSVLPSRTMQQQSTAWGLPLRTGAAFLAGYMADQLAAALVLPQPFAAGMVGATVAGSLVALQLLATPQSEPAAVVAVEPTVPGEREGVRAA